jgi:hypothetical protein
MATNKSYSKDLAAHLQASCEIAKILVKEQCLWRCEFIDVRRPNPKVYLVNDIVFAHRVVQSDAAQGRVDKLAYPFTSPWCIITILHGASYKIKHCSAKKWEKRHVSDLSPYPIELIPLHPLNSADNQYGQIHKKILDDPCIQVGIKGF